MNPLAKANQTEQLCPDFEEDFLKLEEHFLKLGETVRQIREKKGLKQKAVAQALNVSPGYISNVENGRTAMSLKILYYYAELTHTSLDVLVGVSKNGYIPTEQDFQIMNIIYALPPDKKKKLLETARIWFDKAPEPDSARD